MVFIWYIPSKYLILVPDDHTWYICVCIFSEIYIHACIWYILWHCKSKYTYVHGIYMYIQVYTSLHYFILVLVYTLASIFYIHTCMVTVHKSIFHTFMSWYMHQMFCVQIGTDNFDKHTDSFELSTYTDMPFRFLLFVLPFWLACKQVLAAARCQA